jgi:signal transduction histidine kinase
MKARVIDNSDGAQSYYTDPKRVTIKSVEPFSLGTFILNWLSLILIAIVATFLILLILWYSYRKFREIKNRIARRMNRAEALLPRDIEELTKNLVENHDMLMAVAENRDLTKEEDAMLENLKRQLETTDKDLIEKVKSSRYLP